MYVFSENFHHIVSRFDFFTAYVAILVQVEKCNVVRLPQNLNYI